MLVYILRRVLIIIPMLLAVSIVAFLVIQAPPGDFLTVYISQLESRGEQVADDQAQALRLRWGLDQPLSVQYLKWLRSMLRGNMGFSMVYNRPVTALIIERLPGSVTISLAALFIVYLIGLPVGMISAIHQYSVRDYVFTVIGFLGLAIPTSCLLWCFCGATTGSPGTSQSACSRSSTSWLPGVSPSCWICSSTSGCRP